MKQFVFARDGGRCRQCGAINDLQFDHVISVALGGGSSADNLQLLCGPCNRRKGAGLTSGYPSPMPQQSAAATWIPPSSPPEQRTLVEAAGTEVVVPLLSDIAGMTLAPISREARRVR